MDSLQRVFTEIFVLFALGGLYYLYQRRKYLRYHEDITQDFRKRLIEVEPSLIFPESTKDFEDYIVGKYKQEKNLKNYSHKVQEILFEYIEYIESISGPLL